MKLDRNVTGNGGKGKYVLVNLRRLEGEFATKQQLAYAIALNPDCLELGVVGAPDEFFVLKLRDINAQPALQAYAKEAHVYDPEYAKDIQDMASRSGAQSPFCKQPD